MALQIMVTPPVLEMDEVHTGTIIEVYDDQALTSLRLSATLDSGSLLHHTFDVELTGGVEYYVRGRFILTPGGLQSWSPTYSFIAGDTVDLNIMVDPPIQVPPPLILRSLGNIDTPATMMKFRLALPANLNFKIEEVNWVITNDDGTVVFSSISDSKNLTGIILDAILEANTGYMLKASVKTVTNAVSMMGTFPFTTGKIVDRGYSFDRTRGDYGENDVNTLYLTLPSGYMSTEYKVLVDDEVLGTYTTTDDTIDLIGKKPLDGDFVIMATATMADGTTRGPVYYYYSINMADVLPQAFDYELR